MDAGIEKIDEIGSASAIVSAEQPVYSVRPIGIPLDDKIGELAAKGYNAFFIADHGHPAHFAPKVLNAVARQPQVHTRDIFTEAPEEGKEDANSRRLVKNVWNKEPNTTQALIDGLVRDGYQLHPTDTYLGPNHWVETTAVTLGSPDAAKSEKVKAAYTIFSDPSDFFSRISDAASFRSANMAEVIAKKSPELLKAGGPLSSVVFMVGAGHLNGKGNVMERLKQKGTPLKIAVIHAVPVKDKAMDGALLAVNGTENEFVVTGYSPTHGMEVDKRAIRGSAGQIFLLEAPRISTQPSSRGR